MTEDIPSGDRFNLWRPRAKSAAGYIAIVTLFAGVLSLTLASPLLLRAWSREQGINWTQLSNIGQAYGAASAILSGVALIGVSLSLLVQARQASAERTRVVRERHMEIIRIALDNPKIYAPVLGIDSELGSDSVRSRLFATMLMNYGRMGYQMGVLTENALRADFFGGGLFQSELGRNWWTRNRQLWISNPVPDRRARKFVEIADDEYQKAINAGPPAIMISSERSFNDRREPSRRGSCWRTPSAIVSGVAIGLAISSRVVGRRSRARR